MKCRTLGILRTLKKIVVIFLILPAGDVTTILSSDYNRSAGTTQTLQAADSGAIQSVLMPIVVGKVRSCEI